MVIFDNGVLIRKTTPASFLKRIFIPFEDVNDVEIEDKHFNHSPWLVLHVKTPGPYLLNTSQLPNYKKILSMIKKNKKGTKSKKDLLFITKRIYGRMGYDEMAIPIECKGNGTENEPFLVVETQKLPRTIYISNYSLYIHLTNINSKSINLEGCQNLIIEDFKLRSLKLDKCQNIMVKNCIVKRIKLSKSSNNTFKDNIISRLKELASKNNKYQSNQIKQLKSSVIEKSFRTRNQLKANEIQKAFYSVKK